MLVNHRMIKICLLALVVMVAFSLVGVSALSVERLMDSDSITQSDAILDQTLLSSNAFTQPDDLSEVSELLSIPDTFIKVGETDSLVLYMEDHSFAIRVVNKNDGENGFIHGSSFGKTGDNYSYLGTTWEENVNSAVVLSYYVYNDNNGQYSIVEESFLSSEASVSDYRLIENGFMARMRFGRSGIELTLKVYLDGNYLRVEIPNDSIVEGDYQLRSIKVYQFFGSVLEDTVPGYIFVPDGSGALIRYQALNVHTDTYNFQYYGTDLSKTAPVENEPVLSFPVTGVVQGINQHAFITMVDEGAAFANYTVSPAKTTLRYYFSYNEFRYRSLYQTPKSQSQAENQSGTQVTEDELNSFNLALTYQFLAGDEANYVGMANAYRDYLIASNRIYDRIDSSSNLSVMVELIGAEEKKGFIFDETLVMTTFDEASVIINELSDELSGMNVVYKGYTRGGATGAGLRYDSLNRSLGSNDALNQLIEIADSTETDLSFYLDMGKVYEDGSFNLYKDVVHRINQNLLGDVGLTKAFYYVAADRLKTPFQTSLAWLAKRGIDSVTLDTIGYTLYSDYKDSDHPLDRNDMIELVQTLLADYTDLTSLYRPNDYLLAYTNAYLSTPMTTSGYRIYSDTVPFTSYVLASALPAYSPFMNFSSSMSIDVLKMVDYNIRPSYVVTMASAYQLQDTELGQLYSSTYATWKSPIVTQAKSVALALDNVINSVVMNRVVLEAGLNQVTYDNGVIIYINYTNETKSIDTTTVLPRAYTVVMPDD